jgi:hypothetical protein
MTDAELEAWVSSIRDCRLQHATLMSHLRKAEKKERKPKEPEQVFE